MIAGLVSYHDWVGTHIVEDVLENMRVGMELNDTKYNQKRLAVAKFLGELYNYRLIDSSVVFKVNSYFEFSHQFFIFFKNFLDFQVLYSVLTFGIDPKEETQILDQPEDMIRIRMICTILETCGAYFVSASSKSKLKYFLAYFQVSFEMSKIDFSIPILFFNYSNIIGKRGRIYFGHQRIP